MAFFVSTVGLFSAAIGLLGLVSPESLARFVERWPGGVRFWMAVVVRIVFGVLFLLAAPACHLPGVVYALGALAIVAAVVILVAGRKRLDDVIAWWLGCRSRIRLSALFAAAAGALLIFAGA